jgi:nitrate/nitrite transporter NarK
LTDRFGARLMLTLYILLWSLFTGLTGAAYGFAVLFVLRLAFGAAQAGAYPTGAAVVSKWVPLRSRGTASSVIAVGGRIGGWAAFYITGLLIVWLVPVSVSSRLAPDDLIDAPKLSHRLLSMAVPHAESASSVSGGEDADSENQEATLPPAIAEQVLARLSSESRNSVERMADQYVEREERIAALKKSGSDEQPPPIEIPAVQLKRLTDDLNAVISERDIFPTAAVPESSPLHSALENEGKRLLAMRRSELKEDEVERLNRLVLQAAFPDSLREVYGLAWRPLMWIYAGVGIFVAGLYWLTTRDRPELHPRVNKQELALIAEGKPPNKPAGAVGGVPIVGLLTSRSIWASCISQWFTNIGWLFLMVWAPRYFELVHRVPVEERASLTAWPALVGWFGMVGGGWLTDFMVRRFGLRWGRALPISLSRFVAMGAYAYCLFFQPSAVWAAVAFCVVAFATDAGTAASWAFAQDVGGRRVGSVLGWGNMWGNLGAFVTPPLLAWVVDIDGAQNWNFAFITCGGAFLLAGLASLFIDASKPVSPDEPEDDGVPTAEMTKPPEED